MRYYRPDGVVWNLAHLRRNYAVTLQHWSTAFMRNICAALTFTEEGSLFLQDATGLLFDVELSHDLGVMLIDPQYRTYRFTQFFWYRNGRPLKREDRLRLKRLRHNSPLELEVAGSLTGIWAFLQIAYRVSTWRVAHERLRLETEKLRLEVTKLKDDQRERMESLLQASPYVIDELSGSRDADRIEARLIRRFERSPLLLESIEVSVEDRQTHFRGS